MITIQNKSSLEVKHVDVCEWLNYPSVVLKQWQVLGINRIVKVFYNDRYLGLQEESRARQLMTNNAYWMVRELDKLDLINLNNRSLLQRIKAVFTANAKHTTALE